MADDRGESRPFNLTEAFLFPKLFRGFRIAIDYRKLLLALIAIGLFYGVGVLTDWVGGLFRGPDVVAVGGVDELDAFTDEVKRGGVPAGMAAILPAAPQTAPTFEKWRDDAEKNRVEKLAGLLAGNPNAPGALAERRDLAEKDINRAIGFLRAKIWDDYNNAAKAVDENQQLDGDAKAKAKIALAKTRESALADVDLKDGKGVFEAFLGFQINRFNKAVHGLAFLPGSGGWEGTWLAVKDMAQAFVWLGKYHWVYAIILGIAWLVLASVFGGAIARLAAVQAARDEKISAPEALKFSIRKFVSFISAPLIPFLIVAVVFVLTMCPAALAGVPFVGEIFVAVLSPLALIMGFIMALVVVGGVGGLGLMHPTIAVEGSDAFDAISRGFSYVYSRPWRSILYNGCAIVYGGLCFLFVKLFVFLMLWLTWSVMGALVWGGPAAVGADGGDKIAAMWAQPGINDLHTVRWHLLQGWEVLGAIGLTIWVGVVVSLLVAFVVSYVYSSQTLIYLLLRKRVDATDLDDVYIEETEEEELFEAPPEEGEEGKADKVERGPAPDEGEAPDAIGAEAPPDEGGEGQDEGGDEGDKDE